MDQEYQGDKGPSSMDGNASENDFADIIKLNDDICNVSIEEMK